MTKLLYGIESREDFAAMLDRRVEQLANNLVTYSLKVRKGEKVLIEAFETDSQITTCLAETFLRRAVSRLWYCGTTKCNVRL